MEERPRGLRDIISYVLFARRANARIRKEINSPLSCVHLKNKKIIFPVRENVVSRCELQEAVIERPDILKIISMN